MVQSSTKIETLAAASADPRVVGKSVGTRPYAPIGLPLERRDRTRRQASRLIPRWVWRRLRADPHVLLAIAIAVPVVAVEWVVGAPPTGLAAAAAGLYIAGQVALAFWRPAPSWLPSLRLAAALGFVLFINAEVRMDATGPLWALLVPIVAMAAASGGRGGRGRMRRARAGTGLSTALLERADVGLGLAKEGGRNRVVAA